MGDVAEDLDASGGALSTAKDLFAGAVGGVAQVLTGMYGELNKTPSSPVAIDHGFRSSTFPDFLITRYYTPGMHFSPLPFPTRLSRLDSSSQKW